MPIITEGLPAQSDHPVFEPCIWRAVLACYTEMQAVHVDMVYGSTQTRWLVQERMVEIPSSNTWLSATLQHSLGMMLYLRHWQVECPHQEDIIQYATDHNQLDILLLFTNKSSVDPWYVPKFCPHLDHALKKNYKDVVRYVLWRFPNVQEGMLDKPVRTLERVMAHNLVNMFRLMVPRLTLVTSVRGLNTACCKGHLELVKYAVDHLDSNYFPNIPEQALVLAAKHGHLKLLKFLKRRTHDQIPVDAFRQAFSWGHLRVCQYIQKRFRHYVPNKSDIIDACKHGHHLVMQLLPSSVAIPAECMGYAAESQNYHLIYTLKKLCPKYSYTPALLKQAACKGSEDVCIALYDAGGYNLTHLPAGMDVTLTTRRMYKALEFFHQLDFEVYHEKTLVEAARICDYRMLQTILKHYRPSHAVLENCLSFIYVSSAPHVEQSNAYSLLHQMLPRKRLHRDTTPSNNPLQPQRPQLGHQKRRKHVGVLV